MPPGFVLTTGLFQPWDEHLRATAAWSAFAAAVYADQFSDEELRKRTADVQAACEGLSFTEAQHQGLFAELEECTGDDAAPGLSQSDLLAVRSSAPQKDLAGASFAAVYESVLRVSPSELPQTVRTVFASVLAFTAVSYRYQRGFDPTDMQIAVIVRQQLHSASAGVAFSLNPQTNDYDEAVIQANWGLGETVVSGSVTPDQLVVDKVAGRRIIDTTLGAKETAVSSHPEHGPAPSHRGRGTDSRALTDGQAVEITHLVQRVETLTAAPVDIEWAYTSDGVLWLLQARPVTTYFPLPEALRTVAGAPRRLYLDTTLLEEGPARAPVGARRR